MNIHVKTKFSDVLAILGAVASTTGLVLAIVSWLDISRDLLISVISALVAFLAGVFSARLATRVKTLMGSPRVFLSYPAALTLEVKAIAELLRRRGAQVWLDQERLKPGQDWRSEIAHARWKTPILFWSSSAMSRLRMLRSNWGWRRDVASASFL